MRGEREMKKKWKLILGAIILLGSIGFVFTHMTQGLNVVVLKVKAKEFTRSFTEEGVVASVGECRIQSLYPAKIDRLLVKEGDTVEAGQLLVVLDDAELKYSLAELEATYNGLNVELEQARENQAQAERNYQRVVRLYEAEVAAEVELEEAQSRLNQAKTAVAGIEAKQQALLSQMERLRHQRAAYRIYAPTSGIVSDLAAEENGLTGPQVPLLTLLNREGKQVETRILTRDVNTISPGMQVNLTFKLTEQDLKFPGEVTAIAPYAESSLSSLGLEEERVKVTIAPEFPAGVKIDPGYKLDVEFIAEVIPDALVVPKTALFTYAGKDALFVVEGEQVQIRQVETGAETRREIVITSGLQAGDLVILDPQLAGLAEGAKVSYQISDSQI
jgi:HlyD family secretion protein